MDVQKEQSIKQILNDNVVINRPSFRIVYGKEILNPLETISPVSQVIKEYIKNQFAVSKINTKKNYKS